MKLQTLLVNKTSVEEFITFWSAQYDHRLDNLYNNNIILSKLYSEHIHDLFLWKNGMKLSGKKETSLKKVISNIDVINRLKQNFTQREFEQNFGDMPAIWKIFLLHIITPEDCPIFDQHVYRAYRSIMDLSDASLPDNKIEKEELYYNQYRPFYQLLRQQASNFSIKVIDEALWAYGRFLSKYPRIQ